MRHAPPAVSTLAAASLDEVGDVLEVGVMTIDAGLVIRGWNRWLEVASERRASQVIGRPVLSVFPELRGSAADTAFRSAVSGSTVVFSHRFHRYLLPLPAPPGYERFDQMQQSARIIPLVRDGGHVEGALALIQDVTERVAREDDLRQAVERAEEASRAKSDFLAAMSHDFRTPLAAVISYTDLMTRGASGPVTPLQAQQLGRIRSSAEHLVTMINEVLAFATVEAGKERVHLEEFDATTLASETVEMLEARARERGLAMEFLRRSAAAPIRSDPTKVRQILINLLGNALKFTDRGKVSLEVAVGEGRILFRVCDTGPGIARQDLKRIFEPFIRVEDRSTAGKSGTGLGLAVSCRLARLLGGDIEAESELGVGSTFTFWLPIVSADTDARPATPRAAGMAQD